MKGLYIILLLILLQSEKSIACRCENEMLVEESVKYSDIVMKGVVISRLVTLNFANFGVVINGDTTLNNFNGIYQPIAVYKIKVNSVYKGNHSSDTITIITAVTGAACGVKFSIGKEWIIYATIKDETIMSNSIQRYTINKDTYWTNLCMRNTEWDEGEENDIKKCL